MPRDLGSIECPVRIVWGTRDTLLLPRQADRFVREIPNAELVGYRASGTCRWGTTRTPSLARYSNSPRATRAKEPA